MNVLCFNLTIHCIACVLFELLNEAKKTKVSDDALECTMDLAVVASAISLRFMVRTTPEQGNGCKSQEVRLNKASGNCSSTTNYLGLVGIVK